MARLLDADWLLFIDEYLTHYYLSSLLSTLDGGIQDGRTPLVCAAMTGGVDRAKLLLKYGADKDHLTKVICGKLGLFMCGARVQYRVLLLL